MRLSSLVSAFPDQSFLDPPSAKYSNYFIMVNVLCFSLLIGN